MALLNSELTRIKFELGYHLNSRGAVPYVGYAALFEAVIQPYLDAGAKTTSTTYVADPGGAPTVFTLTLASATGFAAGEVVWVDLDARQESATIEEVSGSTIKLFLSKPHGALAGTSQYPITVEGGEAIVRELLQNIRGVRVQMQVTTGQNSNAAVLASSGGLKRVDEIEFYGNSLSSSTSSSGGSIFSNLNDQLIHWQDELAMALGVRNLRKQTQGGGGRIALY